MTKTIETNGDFTITQTGDFSFVVTHKTDGKLGEFRTVARCRDLIDMLNGNDL